MSMNITNNFYLRNLYGTDRSLVNKNERKLNTSVTLAKADSKALAKGISALGSYDYEAEETDETDFYNTLKAFADSYNYTLDSGGDNTEPDIKNLMKHFKELQANHEDELADFGITFDEDGYMNIAKSAVENIDIKRFREVLGTDTEFIEDLSALQKKLSRRINYLA